jgi:DNA-binding NarL/FixJ family response regulator
MDHRKRVLETTEVRDTDTRVLLVDDDPVILDILCTGLEKAGYCVEACSEASGALTRYREAVPDVAVLDVGLPDMAGTDLARELLRTEYRPILILSSYKDLKIVEQAITSGVVGYLVKPLSVDQLIPSLETSLSRYRKRGEDVASHLGAEVSRKHLSEVLDQFPFALLIVDENHHPIYRNSFARDLLDDQVLTIDPAGRLRSRRNSERLVAVIDHGLGRTDGTRPGAVLLDEEPCQRLHAWAAPLGGGTEDRGESLAMVVVFDAARGRAYTWSALRTLYGLTRKETDMVNGLLQGQTLEDYCAANFVTANTARTHLKAIYRKTGTGRQAELVRLFSAMFMPAAAR